MSHRGASILLWEIDTSFRGYQRVEFWTIPTDRDFTSIKINHALMIIIILCLTEWFGRILIINKVFSICLLETLLKIKTPNTN